LHGDGQPLAPTDLSAAEKHAEGRKTHQRKEPKANQNAK
jgi:hypothetical protein